MLTVEEKRHMDYSNAMERATMIAEQKDSRLQQVRIHSNTTAVSTEMKERSCLPSEGLRYIRISSKILLSSLPTLK